MKFQTKIMLCITLLLAVAFGVGNSILLTMSFQNSLAQKRSAVYNTYQMLLYSLDAVSDSGTADMHNILYQLDAQNSGWVALRLKSNDIVLYSSVGGGAFRNDLEAQTKMHHCSMQTFRSGGAWYLQLTGRFLCGGKPFTLNALYSQEELYHARDMQIQNYRVAFCVMSLMGVALSWMISRWLTAPLRQLSLLLRKITAGDLTCRAEVRSDDEIGNLARDLNHMTGQLEANIAQLKDAMRRQEEFMGSFAHELKTPMTAIIGYADLLRSQSLSAEEVREAANYMFSEGRRLERLSLKLLELLVSRQGVFQLAPCRPKVILEHVVQSLEQGLVQQGITFHYSSGAGICCLEPDLLHSLLVNLIDNARKATERGGTITVEVETPANLCRIRVRDTGRGIAADELGRISEPFYRVDKSRSRAEGGAGLGLALCSEIIKIHHGTIVFESTPGQGTCVTAELKGGEGWTG